MNNNLNTLLSHRIPKSSPHKNGFLEICGIAHHENVNSRIYAYFINSPIREVSSIFINSLTELIFRKTARRIELKNYYASLEESTDKYYRIDILIKDENLKTAIIIENKIYHILDNDLENYWNHVKYPEENKIGILLTLNPYHKTRDLEPNFINITHREWMERILETGLSDEIPSNYRQYITDFSNTIKNLSTSYAMNEQTKFYFENAQTIIEAKKTMDEAYSFIPNQIDLLAGNLGWKSHGSSWNWRNIWDADNTVHTYFSIIYGDLLEGKFKFNIILELWDKDKEEIPELELTLKDNRYFHAKGMRHKTKNTGQYVHFCNREYSITMEELERFGDHLYELILRDFAGILIPIIDQLYPNNEFTWKSKFDLNVNKEAF